jgi:hypothetical protein
MPSSGLLSSLRCVSLTLNFHDRSPYRCQFVGGDTAEDALPVLRRLRAENKGTALAYSVEAHESSVDQNGFSAQLKHSDRPMHKRIVDEIIHCIDVAADFEDSLLNGIAAQRKTWVAIKMVWTSVPRLQRSQAYNPLSCLSRRRFCQMQMLSWLCPRISSKAVPQNYPKRLYFQAIRLSVTWTY